MRGTVQAPPSKSYGQRAIAAALLMPTPTILVGLGADNDTRAALGIAEALGCTVSSLTDGSVEIRPGSRVPEQVVLDCGESGLAARLFTPIAAMRCPVLSVSGHGSLLQRPMGGLGRTLTQLGFAVQDNHGRLPLRVTGTPSFKDIDLGTESSSQYLTGILFALAGNADRRIAVRTAHVVSKPYIDLSLQVLERFGFPVATAGYSEFIINPASFAPPPQQPVVVEGDWSSAAFLLVAGALTGKVTLEGLNPNSAQADRNILEVLRIAGARISILDDSITVDGAQLDAFETDATHCPDLFPILAVLAAGCRGESEIRGLHRLFDKESNRVESIGEMLLRFGVGFSMDNDMLYIKGQRGRLPAEIDPYNDHRIAMAAAVMALTGAKCTTIKDADCISKSYPAFFEDLRTLGANVRYMHGRQ